MTISQEVIWDTRSFSDESSVSSRSVSYLTSEFMIACLILGLEQIHSWKIIHWDLKPENLVFDYQGYLHIADFGISRFYRANNRADTSGTPGYMAPEVINHQNHTYSVDFYALGVIMYELIIGVRPYCGTTWKELKFKILERQACIKQSKSHFSDEGVDFVNQLIQRYPRERIGHVNGTVELKLHPWFEGFQWDLLYDKKLKPLFAPLNKDNFDSKHVNNPFNDGFSDNEKPCSP